VSDPDPATSPPAEPAPTALPTTLRWAVWLLLAEAFALGAVAAFLAYQDITGIATNLAVALGVTGFAVAAVAALVAVARALSRRRPGARGPAIVLQLMLVATAYYMLQAGLLWLGVPIIAVALLICGLVVSPPTTRALGLG
jgi:hypothetical protein